MALLGSAPGATAAGRPKADASRPAGALPAPVQDMVDAIGAAVRSGDIEDLREALDWNEMKPDLGGGPARDPIADWRAASTDGSGAETLTILGRLLATAPAAVPLGRDIENNRLYVWPGFATTPLARLSQGERSAFEALVPLAERGAMEAGGRYLGPRLVIGADGTRHRFSAGP